MEDTDVGDWTRKVSFAGQCLVNWMRVMLRGCSYFLLSFYGL